MREHLTNKDHGRVFNIWAYHVDSIQYILLWPGVSGFAVMQVHWVGL